MAVYRAGGLKPLIVQNLIERPVAERTFDELAAELEASGADLEARFARASSSAANAEQLRHIIGIERWGQRRLKVAFGEPLDPGGYRPFRPADDRSWDALLADFRETRAATVELVRSLDVGWDLPIPHDSLGDLSVRGWVQYLRLHAALEGFRIR